tara:strand:- start:335 stop:637 length:303 start_codon:yes stop_codon:yes gene_type:complete
MSNHTKTALRAFAQSKLTGFTHMRPRRYEVMVYNDKAHWDDGVAHHDCLYGDFITKAEAWKQIKPKQVLDVFVYTEMTPDDSFGELWDTVTIDLAEIADK